MSASQELPPRGGYPKIRYKRNLPNKGPSGAVFLTGVFAVMAYGWYHVYHGIQEKRENTYARIYLLPLLTAETQRDQYRRHLAAIEREKIIMKDVMGWEAGKSVYHTDRFVPSAVANIPLHQQ
ncbi:hypothetical protein BB560_004926 [Smittium megazygosporum]|uniref:NADH dehydrogenase [ubiquinone] 1 alpha subcomplex subunit 13 n=1 Tax=Smittium megazygosporum TaxID=133381 RepID=A0A2T9Z7X0_9FUNG|nr:hypothetical protein BB560_004926 [Smittium megazygosporum]